MSVTVTVRQLPHGLGLLPERATSGAAGYDLTAAVDEDGPITLAPFARAMVPTGLALALPHGFEGQIRPRSGLAAKSGITVLNAPGTVDADFRGEVMVILVNLSNEPFIVARGMRIAQLVISPVSDVLFVAADTLDETARGSTGFGSTGIDP